MARDTDLMALPKSELVRRVEAFQRQERERAESGQEPSDIEGIANHVANLIFREKNFPYAMARIEELRTAPFWTHPADPEHELMGFDGAVEYAQTFVAFAITSARLSEFTHPLQVQAMHDLETLWNEPYVEFLVRPDWQGHRARARLKRAVKVLVFDPAVPTIYSTSQETEVNPTESPRQSWS